MPGLKFKKAVIKIHRWLGLSSGLLVFLISLSGVLYTFHEEIFNVIHTKSMHVKSEGKEALPLDSLFSIVQSGLGEEHPITYVNAYAREDLAWRFKAYRYNPEKVTYFSWCEFDYVVYINQYTGEILEKINHKYEFFQLVKMFHWSFWLRTDIGQPIVGWTVVLFLISLIAGILWWWPRNNKFKKRLFSIRWHSISLVIYRDWHVVTGIFSLPVILILSFTGMVWAFKWFMAVVYIAANLGNPPPSKTPEIIAASGSAIPAVYETIYRESRKLHPNAHNIVVYSINQEENTVATYVRNQKHVYYDSSLETWDASTGVLLHEKSFGNLNNGEKLISMNYDIHTGAFLGIGGKIIVFIAGIAAVWLPLTGFIVWLKKYRIRKS